MKLNRTLLKLLRQGGPANDFNFKSGSFPDGLSFSRASSATVFAPNRKGSNLVYNGDFSLGTVGWTNYLSPSMTVVDGALRVAAANANHARAYQVVPTKVGTTYHLRGRIVSGAAAYIIKADSLNYDDNRQDLVGYGSPSPYATYHGDGLYSMDFVATSDATHIHLLTNNGGSFDVMYDDISVQEYIIGEANSPITQVLVGSNKPRINWDPQTGRCKGLLSEPASTNRIVSTFTGWWTANVTIQRSLNKVARNTMAGAYLLTTISTGEFSCLYTYPGAVLSQKHVFRMDVMAGSSDALTLGLYSDADGWGPSGKTRIVSGPGTMTPSGTAHMNLNGLSTTEWTTIEIIKDPASNGQAFPHIYPTQTAGSTIYLSAPQLELGDTVTSFIPSPAGPTSRAADIATWVNHGLSINQSFCVEFEREPVLPPSYAAVFESQDGWSTSVVVPPDGTGVALTILESEVGSERFSGQTTGLSALNKVAWRMSNNPIGYINGVQFVSNGVPGHYPIGNRVLTIGHRYGGSLPFNGHIERIRRFKRLMSDTELQYYSSLNEDAIEELDLIYEFDFTLGSLPAGITFSRASSATVFAPKDGNIFNPLEVRTVAANVPRFQYDENSGECLGLLIEPQRTNYLTHSSDISDWTQRGTCTITAERAPDGTGRRVNNVLGGGDDFYMNAPMGVAATRYEVQIKIWPISTSGKILLNNPSDTALGLWEVDLGILKKGAWNLVNRRHPAVKIVSEFITTGGTNGGFHCRGAGVLKSFYAKDIQAEIGTEPTSYIPTTSSSGTVTRAADVTYKNNVPFRRNGTIFVDFIRNHTGKDQYVLALGAPGGMYRYLIYTYQSETLYGYADPHWSIHPGLKGLGERIKAALAYTPTVSKIAKHGVVSDIADSGSNTMSPSQLAIGNANSSSYQEASIIANVKYFGRTLSPQELKVLTTLE